MGRPHLLGGSLAFLLFFIACTTPDKKPDWITKPNVPRSGFIVTATGSARIQGDIPSARMEAEGEAKRRLASFLKTKIFSITKNLDKQVGDLLRPGSLISFVNNQTVTLEIVQATLQGAIPLEYYTDLAEDTVYVLVGLASKEFVRTFSHMLERNLDEMLPKEAKKSHRDLEAMKAQARERLQKLLEEEARRHEKK